ncbi:hypothetical protein CLOSTMETH_01509 [[Clostridium] methylpentosum DSM 5476]|uniref:Uncharacterized protein n=1 Tax=[Clostridium] methylpentosum DSM 5476 TaxID=537013 RepID=C0ECD9_9FIRM|nr:hypothetical protein CLOSTMETH_01509 [[Clostridium] methylpentosum DSM 5476]
MCKEQNLQACAGEETAAFSTGRRCTEGESARGIEKETVLHPCLVRC